MKRLLLKLLSSAITICAVSDADAQWSLIHSIYNGTMASDGATTFVFGDKGYIVGGASTNLMYRYDTTANSWTNLGPIPASAGQAFAMSFTLNGKGYVVGGDTSGVPTNTVWRYDPANSGMPWTQMNNFTPGMRDAGIAFVVNDTAYVGLGFDGTSLHNDLWRYNEANDSWTQMTGTLPTVLMFPACFVVNNRAFIVSGSTNGVAETNQMWEFNTGTQSFTPKAALPSDARQAAFAFGNGNYGYLGGGQAGYTDNFTDMWRYNPDSNTWASAGTIPLFGPSWASAFTIGNTAYVGLGAYLTQTGLQGNDSFYRYRMQSPTSVQSVVKHKQVSVYPNPVGDALYIDGNKDGRLIIYNNVGAAVTSVIYKQGEAISLTNLAPGYYTIKLTAQNNETWYGGFLKE